MHLLFSHLLSEIRGSTYPGVLGTWLIPFFGWTKSVEFLRPNFGKNRLGEAVPQHGQKCSREQNTAWTAIFIAKQLKNSLPKLSLSKRKRITKIHTTGGIRNIYLEASSLDAYAGRWVPPARMKSSQEFQYRAQLFSEAAYFSSLSTHDTWVTTFVNWVLYLDS